MTQLQELEELFGVKIWQYNTVIIGSGAAGLNCALHLVEEGIKPNKIAILTERLGGGTSFNAGSDKQTYYKLSIIGDKRDSPHDMARDMADGGAMHGDIALIEATNSIREFFHLVQLSVPFPHDKYGGYVGYKTDYDPRQRATSIGPLTSQKMGQCLLSAVKEAKIKIWNNHYASKLIVNGEGEQKRVRGVMALSIDELADAKDIDNLNRSRRFFLANNIIIATGGPAALYKHSVYPKSQWGSLGLAINAGCKLQNLTESQFGLASTEFRWNLSGSYQQVIPRYFSINDNGKEIEFLNKHFPSFKELSNAIFLKGYQWPFNSARIENLGSSLIDLAVYYETEILERKVFLDFRRNPQGYEEDKMASSALQYLKNSNAMAAAPVKRLKRLNPDAIDLYKQHGINLWEEPLQVAVCNQHLNGGIQGDIWWETNISHLFATGEANGSHGVHRPGGSALNSGQVGGLRAAQKIVNGYEDEELPELNNYKRIIERSFNSFADECKMVLSSTDDQKYPDQILAEIRERMAKFGSIIRPLKGLSEELKVVERQIQNFSENVKIKSNRDVISYLRVKDALKTQQCILSALLNYHNSHGKSRGSYLVIRDELNDSFNEHYITPPNDLEQFQYIRSEIDLKNQIQTIKESQGGMEIKWEGVRDIPREFGWFESVWKKYKTKELFK